MDFLIEELALAGLFIGTFLAATILPFSSEAILIGYLKTTDYHWTSFFVASAGNLSGIIFNYYMGYYLDKWSEKKSMKIRTAMEKVHSYSEKYGKWALLFSGLPFIGDPLTIAAGYVKINFWFFLTVCGLIRIARYLVVMWIFN